MSIVFNPVFSLHVLFFFFKNSDVYHQCGSRSISNKHVYVLYILRFISDFAANFNGTFPIKFINCLLLLYNITWFVPSLSSYLFSYPLLSSFNSSFHSLLNA